ncbi:tetratricopeptide repeat protein [Chondrinema litorale]|uniref:tetratricopeptide repeat protein n=1 Tax=Chondrinema litorale TaxID=2994555 RepID=UPI002543C387|nr:tetratricopeptide repeat protein [Chondrinema litorale]UZR93453.1 tetratricopeptide repeat protein [Chondrinema litorale]
MAKKDKTATRKTSGHKEDTSTKIYESPEALQDQLNRTQQFADKNKNLLTGVLTVAVLIIGGIFWYKWYVNKQDVTAQEQLFPAVFYFEKDSLNKALDGDGNYTDGFVAISDEYGVTEAGNLADFYAGVSFLKEGEYDQAISHLSDFSSDDYLVQARVYCLLGDAYLQKGQTGDAVSNYKKATEYYPNKEFTPMYLLKLATAYEVSNDINSAAMIYQSIIDDYPAAQEVNTAKKYLAKIQ